MQKFNALLLIFLSFIICGCSNIQSTYHFKRGSDCLEKDDIQGDRYHLEEACALDSSVSCNHHSLSSIYIRLGEMDKAWYHAKKAAYQDPSNQEAVANFDYIMSHLENTHNIGKNSSIDDVKETFGEPDLDTGGEDCTLQYGLVLLVFKEKKLVAKSKIFGMRGCWSIAPPKLIN